MSLAWHILHFLIRIAMGICFSIGLTSPRQVTSGFFRIHLWVVMGIAVLAALVAWSLGSDSPTTIPRSISGFSVLLAVTSYLAASCWIYEAHRTGRLLTVLATVGSSAPFIGLFGTVIGIIDAFQGQCSAQIDGCVTDVGIARQRQDAHILNVACPAI